MSVKCDPRKILPAEQALGSRPFGRCDVGAWGRHRRRPAGCRAAMVVSWFDDARGDNAP
jgi:hypothetical protein